MLLLKIEYLEKCEHRGAKCQKMIKEMTMVIELVTTKNGPYLVTGDLAELELRDGEGNLHNVEGKKRIFLCRCGASTTKPFCDGQHKKIGFQASENAV
jgi:CDGSH-type Zn-finger protein